MSNCNKSKHTQVAPKKVTFRTKNGHYYVFFPVKGMLFWKSSISDYHPNRGRVMKFLQSPKVGNELYFVYQNYAGKLLIVFTSEIEKVFYS